MKSKKSFVVVATSIALFGLGNLAYAGAISFTDDFGDGVLNPLLEDVSGVFTESGGDISNTSGLRSFIRTVASDFNTTPFVYEITINLSSTEIAFVGFGPGTPDSSFNNEPFGANFRIHSNDLASGEVHFATNTVAGGALESFVVIGFSGNGTHRSRVTFDGINTLTFDYDQNFSGSFLADFSSTVALSTLPFDATNSHLFFGSTGNAITSFDNLSVSVPVPEPGTLFLLAAGLLVGAAFRKRFK